MIYYKVLCTMYSGITGRGFKDNRLVGDIFRDGDLSEMISLIETYSVFSGLETY